MSRIGKQPIDVPAGVDVTFHANVVTIKGPKGALSLAANRSVRILHSDRTISIEKVGTAKDAAAIWGTTGKLIRNMVDGVTKGFEKRLELKGVGLRMAVAGRKLNLALGFSHPVQVDIPTDIEAKIDGEQLAISGIDRQKVGQFAADIRKLKPVEPYKGKGFRYVGEHVRIKEGKKAAAA